MFLAEAKTVANQAMRTAFGDTHPIEDFRSLTVSIEYPAARSNYPGIWTDFTPRTLSNVGLGHYETTEPNESDGVTSRFKRWEGEADVSYTVVSLSALEHARLHDEVIKVIGALGPEEDSEFRAYVEHNGLLAMDVMWEAVTVGGYSAVPGTPWGSDEVIYEATITVPCRFEFVSDPSGVLLPIEEVRILSRTPDTPDTTENDGNGSWL